MCRALVVLNGNQLNTAIYNNCSFLLLLCILGLGDENKNTEEKTMLCYVMLCYVMLCYVMLCYVMLCYVMLCYVMLYDSDVTFCESLERSTRDFSRGGGLPYKMDGDARRKF